MDKYVYALCAFAALICTVLLVRGYLREKTRLLLWGIVCFAVLTLANVMLYVDLVVLAGGVDLLIVRNVLSLVGAGVLFFGLIFETV